MAHKIVAGYNMPGCLPESEPVECKDMREAVQYLTSESDRFWDEDYERIAADPFNGRPYIDNDTNTRAARLRADEQWLPLHAALAHVTEADSGFNHMLANRSLVFWIDRQVGE